MSTAETSVPLPEQLIVKTIQEYGEEEFAQPISRALQRVLQAEASERIFIMQLGMDAIDQASEAGMMYSYPCVISPEILEEFADYCEEMNLRPELLLVGAVMLELELESLPTDLPRFSDVCSH